MLGWRLSNLDISGPGFMVSVWHVLFPLNQCSFWKRKNFWDLFCETLTSWLGSEVRTSLSGITLHLFQESLTPMVGLMTIKLRNAQYPVGCTYIAANTWFINSSPIFFSLKCSKCISQYWGKNLKNYIIFDWMPKRNKSIYNIFSIFLQYLNKILSLKELYII